MNTTFRNISTSKTIESLNDSVAPHVVDSGTALWIFSTTTTTIADLTINVGKFITLTMVVALVMSLCMATTLAQPQVNSFSDFSLHRAVMNADVNKVRDLIEAGTNINQTDEAGITPLNLTAYIGQVDIP